MRTRFTLLLLALFVFSGVSNAQNVLIHAGKPWQYGHIATGTYRLDAYLAHPYGLAFDSKGNLWFTNHGNIVGTSSGEGNTVGVIYKNDSLVYIRSGSYGYSCLKTGTGVGITNSKYSGPAGIDVGPGDTIYIADKDNHVIRKLTPLVSLNLPQTSTVLAGKYSYVNPTDYCYSTYPGYKDGPANTAQFLDPTDVAVDSTGIVYVADRGNHCIRRIDQNGNVTTYAGQGGQSGKVDGDRLTTAKFSYPTAITIYDGKLYVSDRWNSAIRVIDGNNVSTLDSPKPSLFLPEGLHILANGNMYIADQHKVQFYDYSKTITFAGSPTLNDTGMVNDTGTAARFNTIMDVVVDPSNERYIYAADHDNHLIRKLVICESYKPNVDIDGNTTTCVGDTVRLTAEAGFQSYEWSTGEKTRELVVTKQGSLNLSCTVLNDDGCPGYSDPIAVSINKLKPTVTPNGLLEFCTGGSVILVGQSGLDYYVWTKDGATVLQGTEGVASSYTATQPGTYVLTGTSGPCTGASADYVVKIVDHIVPDIEVTYGDTNLCEGDGVKLQTTQAYTTYAWMKNGTSVGVSTRAYTIGEAGSYAVYVTESNSNCNGTSYPVTVTTRPSPAKPTISYEVTGSDTSLKSSATSGNQWYLYGTPISGATSQTYTPLSHGYYKVEVTNAEGCSKFSDEVNFGNTSIQENDFVKDLQIYPNPNNGNFSISAGSIEGNRIVISMQDLLGHTVFETTDERVYGSYEKDINASGFQKGIYFLKIYSDGNQLVRKIVIE